MVYFIKVFQTKTQEIDTGIAQLVERHLTKVAVDGSSPFARSISSKRRFLMKPPFYFATTTTVT